MHKKNQSMEQQQQEQQRKKQQAAQQEEEQLLQALSGKIDANSCGNDEEAVDKRMNGPNRPSI